MTLNKNIKTVILVANRNELAFETGDESIAVYEIGVGKVNAVIALSKLYLGINSGKIKATIPVPMIMVNQFGVNCRITSRLCSSLYNGFFMGLLLFQQMY